MFSLGDLWGAMEYYICRKHLPCVFLLERSRVTSDDGVCIINCSFINHFQCEDDGSLSMMWTRLVLPGPYGGRHYTCQKVQVCMFPLQGQGDQEVLVGL